MDLLVLVAARDGVEDELETKLRGEAQRLESALGGGTTSALLRRVPDDPFAAQYPRPRAFEWVLHVTAPGAEGADGVDAVVDAVDGMARRLDHLLHADLSGVVVGAVRRVTGDGKGAQRFVYLMRRKADTTTDQFQTHWGGPHAEFGRTTPGILGYDQFHPVPVASHRAASAAGFAVWQIDGVPVLHFDSWQEFVAQAVGSEGGSAALEDEQDFVDMPNSVGFTCDVVARSG